MNDRKIIELMKERAAVKARIDKLDVRIALLNDPWTKRQGRGRHYSAAARLRMSQAAKKRRRASRKRSNE